MENQKKYLSEWWIVNPSYQYYNDKTFSGTLSINEDNKISLVLMVDSEMQFTDHSEFLVINGIMDNTEEGNCATLLNCKMQNSSFRFGSASVSLIEYTCGFLLLHPQVHITSQAKDASFKQIIIEYDHLFNWLGRSSIRHKRGKSFFSTPIIKNPPIIKMKVSGASISIQNGVDYYKGKNIEYYQKA